MRECDFSIPQVLRGAAAVREALDCIGHPDKKDVDVAKIVVENEIAIREFLNYSLFAVINNQEA